MKTSKPITVTVIAIIVILAAAGYISWSLTKRPQLNFTNAQNSSITQGVNVSGTVVAAQDLSLAFQQGGTVSEVDVVADQTVKQGQALVKLDSGDVAAALSQAEAGLSQAQANYQKVVSGDTSADINVSQTAVTAAQSALANAQLNQQAVISQQKQAVQNALTALLNSGLAATPSSNNLSSQNPAIGGSYTGTQQGQYLIKLYNTGSGIQFTASGLENFQGTASNIGPVPLGTQGLTIQFPSGQLYSGDSWTVNIPNTAAASYVANQNAYNAALQTQNQALTTAQTAVDSAQSALTQAQAALQLKQAPAQPEDIASAQAAVDEAKAEVQSAQNTYSQTVLTAPIDGVITSVDTKVGQTVAGSTLAPGPDAIKMISSSQFQIQSYVSETNVGKIKVGDSATVTLTAYGSGVVFPATVIAIDPSSTVQNGINTYKTTLQFNQNDARIKEGMDAEHQHYRPNTPKRFSCPCQLGYPAE